MAFSTIKSLALLITWAPPVDTGADGSNVSILRFYFVREWVNGSDQNITVSAFSTSILRAGLQKGLVYTYLVTAFNPAGEGPPSDPPVSEMAISKPSAPLNLTCTVVGSMQLFLSWIPPLDNGNSGYGEQIPLKGYRLEVRLASGSGIVQSLIISSNLSNFSITSAAVTLSQVL